MITRQRQEKEMRRVIITQAFGMLGGILFTNGFLLAHLSRLGFSSDMILVLLPAPHMVSIFLVVPCAYWADRIGKKTLGNIGSFLHVSTSISFPTRSARSIIPRAIVALKGRAWWEKHYAFTYRARNVTTILNVRKDT